MLLVAIAHWLFFDLGLFPYQVDLRLVVTGRNNKKVKLEQIQQLAKLRLWRHKECNLSVLPSWAGSLIF